MFVCDILILMLISQFLIHLNHLCLGYSNDITEIMNQLPKTCQGFLMSATLSPELNKLKHVVLHSPAVLKLEEDENAVDASGAAADGHLMQYYLDLPAKDKFLVMYVFLKVSPNGCITSISIFINN